MKRDADALPACPDRIGVFGGTFDPPHAGHVSAARDVADTLDLDVVLWVPAHRSPHKSDAPLATDELRLEMVRAATREDPRFRPDDRELRRPPPSFTLDTLEGVRREHPDARLYLIIGVDQLKAFHRWHEPGRIRALATLAVMDRGGQAAADLLAGGAADIGPAGAPDGGEPRPVVAVPVGRVDVSSTGIRATAAAGGSIEGMVPAEVLRIVEREGLYRTR